MDDFVAMSEQDSMLRIHDVTGRIASCVVGQPCGNNLAGETLDQGSGDAVQQYCGGKED